jgi:hypothetical protein
MHAPRVLSIFTVAATLAILGGVAAAQGAPPPPPPPGGGYYAAQPGPIRGGFTGGLDLGLGFTHIAPDGFDSQTETGLSGLNFQLGGFINPNLALSVRVSGTSFTPEGSDTTLVSGLLGVNAQYWVAPKIFVGGGAGIGILTCEEEGCDPETGPALNARAGYEVLQWTASALNISLELSPGFYDGGNVTSVGFQVGWQHF